VFTRLYLVFLKRDFFLLSRALPHRNKGLAFTHNERDRFGLRGLLPAQTRPLEFQLSRALETVRKETSDTRKNLYLQELHSRNETLYHRLLVRHTCLLEIADAAGV